MDKIKLVIFDLDGTLFRTETVDIEAFNKALASMGYRIRTSEDILGLIGLTLEDICKTLLETEDKQLIGRFRELVVSFEEEAIVESGELYPGVEDVLKRLKEEGCILCICSNGNEEYVSGISKKFGFYSIFNEIWFERKNISKSEAVGLLKEKFNAERFIMVGDRLCDIEAGRNNGGISIGAAYGFGGDESASADHLAHSILEAEEIIKKIFEE